MTQKKVSTLRGQNLYLIGKYKDGETIWLREASFDCGWYWGFGYLHTKGSHTHYDSAIIGRHNGAMCHVIGDHADIKTHLTDKEQWTLTELMQSFYTLKQAAEVFGRGGSNYSTIQGSEIQKIIKNADFVKHINEVQLPAIFAEVYKLLSPEAGE